MAVKFKDFNYERPDVEQFTKDIQTLNEKFLSSNDLNTQVEVINDINEKFNYVDTMLNISYVRSSIDTKDKFYDEERTFFDQESPKFIDLRNQFYDALLNSPFQEDLKKKFGTQLFKLAEYSLKSFDPKITELVQKENQLSTEYSKLLASSEIEFDGKKLNLSEFGPYMEKSDREVRKNATLAKEGFFKEHLNKIDEIYDELVKVRDKMAKEMGYKDFVELGYYRMNRIDYDRNMVQNYRNQVKTHVVPLVTELKERQRQRIGLNELKSYDESFEYLTGNASPKGDAKKILNLGEDMYKALSPETNEFYQYMVERDLFDVEAKKGKEGGGYCTYIPDYEAPFIFSNFNGTLDDITVLTHEAGHAFQSYMSRHFEIPEYHFPTLESAEIHSMSMEFFTYPWMELFFKEDTDKFKYTHMVDAVSFLPYGVAIDEFQHVVYENPELTPEDRRNEWKKIEAKYLPHRDYDGIEPLVDGAFWHRQGHLFSVPFYYIDYTLAQVCALQFWKRASNDFEDAWKDYLNLCKLGGSLPFNDLVKVGNIESPFKDGTLESIIDEVKTYLNSIDDTEL